MMSRFDPVWPAIIDAPAGWYPLLAELDNTLVSIEPGYVIQQVKSKFGALRVYASPSAVSQTISEAFQDAICAAERRSLSICEECGEPASQYVIQLWVATLCARHAHEATRTPHPKSS